MALGDNRALVTPCLLQLRKYFAALIMPSIGRCPIFEISTWPLRLMPFPRMKLPAHRANARYGVADDNCPWPDEAGEVFYDTGITPAACRCLTRRLGISARCRYAIYASIEIDDGAPVQWLLATAAGMLMAAIEFGDFLPCHYQDEGAEIICYNWWA